MDKPMEIGEVNWNNQDLIDSYNEVIKIYHNRPFHDNGGGMKLPHLVPCWFYLTRINPKVIIESGVYRGGGTWLFKHASPESLIYSIDINPHNRKWENPDGIYLNEDFTTYDWKEKIGNINVDDVLLFFDDHINANTRIKWIKENTDFKKIIFEDNYPPEQGGECISLKKILSQKDKDYDYLLEAIKVYYEFPPLFVGEFTRWKNRWDEYPTKNPLFQGVPLEGTIEHDEYLDYTWICYVELN